MEAHSNLWTIVANWGSYVRCGICSCCSNWIAPKFSADNLCLIITNIKVTS